MWSFWHHTARFSPVSLDWFRARSSGIVASAFDGCLTADSPVVLQHPTRLACLQCDELVVLSPLRERHRARCPSCRHVLAFNPRGGFARPAAYAIAALVLLPPALLLPFLQLSRSGVESAIRLPDAVVSLAEFGAPGIGVLVALFVIVVPALMLVMVLALVTLLQRDGDRRTMTRLAKALFRLHQWNMAEVFAIGVIVSLVKLAAMATIVLGTAFWSYLGFGVFFIATMANLDSFSVWYRIDAGD